MRIILVLTIALLAFACEENNDFVTESGVEVACHVKGDGAALKKDSVILLQIKIVADNDEVLMESSPDAPLALAYDPEMEAGHLQDVITNLEVGDSVSFNTTVQNLFEETYQTEVPAELDSAGNVFVTLKLADQMSKEAYQSYRMKMQQEQMAKESAMLEEKLTTDGEEIDEFLAMEGIEAQTSDSGLRYVITKEGKGATAEPGDRVKVHYDGRLLSGEPFDSSIERGQPFEFVIGQGRVIPGWDEGIAYIKEGGKGTLYIPSPLGYGARSSGAVIKPYSILVFDVEVLEVTKP